jgi:predicted nucleic acid-binding protein
VGQGYLIDSNSLIDFFNNALPESGVTLLINIAPRISVITQIEIFSKRGLESNEIEKLREFTNTATIYDVNSAIAGQAIKIRLRYSVKLPDAIIAATAICHDLILVTRNMSDFKNITDLKIVNPHAI